MRIEVGRVAHNALLEQRQYIRDQQWPPDKAAILWEEQVVD